MSYNRIKAFLLESNAIEGINREPTHAEYVATQSFLAEKIITVSALTLLVEAYQPDAALRSTIGMNVRVGPHIPPAGGIGVVRTLDALLRQMNMGSASFTPYQGHQAYETLHPFTDGNGRSGRALWLWHMQLLGRDTQLSFLHAWYYQSLQAGR